MISARLSKIAFRQQPPQQVRWGHVTAPMPLMIGVAEDGAVCRIEFARGRTVAAILKEWHRAWPRTEFIEEQKSTAKIASQLFKDPESFRFLMTGTPFQQAVWRQLTKIRAGQTVSYAEVAKRIGKPKAVRAVGTACGKNPLPLLVPCHRVIASNGGFGGFGGGLLTKKALLAEEGVSMPSLRAA